MVLLFAFGSALRAEPPGGDGDCDLPFEVPSQGPFPFARSDDIGSLGNDIDDASCLPLPHSGPDAAYAFTPAEAGRYRIAAQSPEAATSRSSSGSTARSDRATASPARMRTVPATPRCSSSTSTRRFRTRS